MEKIKTKENKLIRESEKYIENELDGNGFVGISQRYAPKRKYLQPKNHLVVVIGKFYVERQNFPYWVGVYKFE